MEELTLEQKKAIAIAKAKMAMSSSGTQNVENDAMGFVNKGLAKGVLGAPVSATAAAMRQFERERNSVKSGIKNLLGKAGIKTPSSEASNPDELSRSIWWRGII